MGSLESNTELRPKQYHQLSRDRPQHLLRGGGHSLRLEMPPQAGRLLQRRKYASLVRDRTVSRTNESRHVTRGLKRTVLVKFIKRNTPYMHTLNAHIQRDNEQCNRRSTVLGLSPYRCLHWGGQARPSANKAQKKSTVRAAHFVVGRVQL